MTVEDILNIIREKRNNACNDYVKTLNEVNDKDPKNDLNEYLTLAFNLKSLQGTIKTYDDLICHIESHMNK